MDGRAGEGGGERVRAQLAEICQSNEYCYELSTLNLRLLLLLVTLKTVIKVVSLILKHVFLLRFSGWIRDWLMVCTYTISILRNMLRFLTPSLRPRAKPVKPIAKINEAISDAQGTRDRQIQQHLLQEPQQAGKQQIKLI